jgi:RimJ/RimL family protein N-acetyltransferase
MTTGKALAAAYDYGGKMTINLIANQWETQHLVVKDCGAADVPELDQIQTACRYMEAWSGWNEPEHFERSEAERPEQSTLAFITEGELPPNGSKEFWRAQSLRLSDTGQMIGFLAIYHHGYPTADFVWINYLLIHPDFQGKGYGQELVCGLCDQVKSLGYTRMRTLVDLKNWPALRFWSQAGFDKIIQYLGDKIISEKTFAHLILEKTLGS